MPEGSPLLAAIMGASLLCGFFTYWRVKMEPAAWWCVALFGASVGWAYTPWVLILGGIILAVVVLFFCDKAASHVMKVTEGKAIEERPPPIVIDVPSRRLLTHERKQEERKKEKKRSVRDSRVRVINRDHERNVKNLYSWGERNNVNRDVLEEEEATMNKERNRRLKELGHE